jgi:hypothetical protein
MVIIIFNLLFLHPSGIDPGSALDSTPWSLLPEKKVQSSGELAVELPPRVFPKDSDEDKPNRQGEELPPSVFPKEFGDKSHSEHDALRLSDKGTITNTEKITVSITKQTPAKKVASEVSDLMNDDTYNRTVYEDGAEGPVQSDTVIVTGPNVINNNKTHEEDVTSPSVEKNENNIKIDSVTSILSTSDANETTNYQNFNTVHDKQNGSTVTEGNVKSTEEFTYNAHTAGATEDGENSTNSGDVIEAFTNAPAADTNIAVKDPKKSDAVSEKNKEKNLKAKSGNKTIKDETITKTESNVSIKDETMTKTESSTTVKDETTAKTESNTMVKDVTTATSVSNTTVKDERTAKTESNTTIKDETAAKTESVLSTTDEISAIKSSFTLPVQQSTITTLQPTLKAEPTTSVNISENVIDHKAEEDIPIVLAASQQHSDHSHPSSGKSSAFLQSTESAAIFAGVFVGIALIGYIGLLVWRRVLE